MHILIDYDNLPSRIREMELGFLFTQLFGILEDYLTLKMIKSKIYGGWYHESIFTRLAQAVSSEISKSFPKYFKCKNGNTFAVIPQLARSIEAEPSRDIYYTYRTRSYVNKIHSLHEDDLGCNSAACPSKVVINFLKKKKCQVESCTTKQKDILFKKEQKIVDAMLVADIVYLGKPNTNICVVSSDDDILPGILSALTNGARILHVKTKEENSSKFPYLSQYPGYNEFTLPRSEL